ncbi:hypothetical protein WMY93_001884 [Mugilogobius chulae]|uniref:Uncharacterized protein n=1 Tax=Mugilogobius chulae TaxID=88201 RepID=A0AAW0PS74_9GOBI
MRTAVFPIGVNVNYTVDQSSRLNMASPRRFQSLIQTRSGGARLAQAKLEDKLKLKRNAKRKNVDDEERTCAVKQASTSDVMGPVKQTKTQAEVYISSDSSNSSGSSFAPDSSGSSSSEDSPKKKKKSKTKKMKKKNKKRKGGNKKRSKDQRQVRRARVPEEVVERYQRVLKSFQRGRSLSKACEKVGVDRNTIVCNAAVAELAIADPQKYNELKQRRNPNDKLSDFTKACNDAICNDIAVSNNIHSLKQSNQLLPLRKDRH